MRRQPGWVVAALLVIVAGRGWAQPDPTPKASSLPMFEQQMGGVRLGWHARSLTGLWNFDELTIAQQSRLARTYRMPDHIIMRLGTKMPVVMGSGAGEDGVMNFYLGAYGRGVSAGGGGGGAGGPGGEPGLVPGTAQAQAPSDQEVWGRVQPFIAQALGDAAAERVPYLAQAQIGGAAGGIAPAPAMPSIAGPSVNAGEFAAPAVGAAGGVGAEPGAGAPGAGGGGGPLGNLGQLPPVTPVIRSYPEIDRLYTAERSVATSEAERLFRDIERLYDHYIASNIVGDEAATARIMSELGLILGRMVAIQQVLSLPDIYHVFHVGYPERDVVFCYEPAPNVWVSFTINFYTWQIDGITVAGNRPWAGAITSTAPDGTPGITLGSSLEAIFNRYGWPDEFESFLGRYLLVHYYDTNNVGFLLDHPAPKVWRVVRMIIEPRPNATERQLAGFRLGQNAQELLVNRARRGHGPIAYGEPYVVERPNHRISVVNRVPEPANRPPGILLDRRLAPVLGAGGGGGAGGPGEAGGPGGAPGGPPPAAAQAAALQQYGTPDLARGGSRPTAQAQQAPSGVPGAPGGVGEAGAGGAGAAAAGVQQLRYPMPFYYSVNTFNDEAACLASLLGGQAGGQPGTEGAVAAAEGAAGPAGGGAGGGAGDNRAALQVVLNQIYSDPSGQVGFNLAYGLRSSTADCPVTTGLPETRYRWDYAFAPDVRAEFGLDHDGMVLQIGVLGTTWAGARSQRGVALGNSLRDVLLRYGPPLLYQEFTQDLAEQQPNIAIMSYARDDRGRAYGNVNFALQDKRVTAMQILALRGYTP